MVRHPGFDGNGIFTQSVFRSSVVQTKAFVDPQAGIACQVEGQNVIIAIFSQGPAQHTVELLLAPGAIHTAEAAALQLHSQLIVRGEGVLCVAVLVVEKADGG